MATGYSLDPSDWLSQEQLDYLKDHVVMTDSQLRTLERQIMALHGYNKQFQRGKLRIGSGLVTKQKRVVIPPDLEAQKADRQQLEGSQPKSAQVSAKKGPGSKRRKKQDSNINQDKDEDICLNESETDDSEIEAVDNDYNMTVAGERSLQPTRRSSRKKLTPIQQAEQCSENQTENRVKSCTEENRNHKHTLNQLEPVDYTWDLEPCGVCGNPAWQVGNSMIMCDGPGCDCIVHLGCYGLENEPKEEVWYCDSCKAGLNPKKANCFLCPVTGGVLRKIRYMGKWRAPPGMQKKPFAHICCVLWHEHIFFGKGSQLDNINLKNLLPEHANLSCEICEQTGNGCSQCSFPNCTNSFHVLCARSRQYKCALRHDGAKFVFCADHSFDERYASDVSQIMGGAIEAWDPEDVNLAMTTEQNCQANTTVELTNLSPEISQIERDRRRNVERNRQLMDKIGK